MKLCSIFDDILWFNTLGKKEKKKKRKKEKEKRKWHVSLWTPLDLVDDFLLMLKISSWK